MFYRANGKRGTDVPDRRGRKGSVEELLPADRLPWARAIWADKEEVAKSDSGPWMLRQAAKAVGLPEEAVDAVLRHGSNELVRHSSESTKTTDFSSGETQQRLTRIGEAHDH
jgi:hypothetical protein